MISPNDPDSPPPVSSLRNKFEQLAASSGASTSTSSEKNGSSGTSSLGRGLGPAAQTLNPPIRNRVLSNPSAKGIEYDQPSLSPTPRRLPELSRSPSSPDLKLAQPGSPLMRPVPVPRALEVTQSEPAPASAPMVVPTPMAHFKTASLGRKPPPPPARHPKEPVESGVEHTGLPSGGVASLRSMFSSPKPMSPVPRAPSPPSVNGTSHAPPPPIRLNRHADAPPIHRVLPPRPPPLHNPSPPRIKLTSSPPKAPPLPSRSNVELKSAAQNVVVQHERAEFELMDSDDSSSVGTPNRLSRASSESDYRPPSPSHSVRSNASGSSLAPPIPPRPPGLTPSPTNSSDNLPPPLPVRRGPSSPVEEHPPLIPPRLPVRPPPSDLPPPIRHVSPDHPPPLPTSAKPTLPKAKIMAAVKLSTQLNHSGTNGIQPPPTRTVLPGGALPPPKRKSSSTESESDDEDDSPQRTVPGPKRTLDELPDSSRANRRPPVFSQNTPSIHVPAHVGVVAASGQHICVGSHSVKIYDLSRSASPIYVIEPKDVGLEWRVKEPRVTAMEFRPALDREDEGRYLWCGTRDGHLWELDVKTGKVVETRPALHTGAVTHIFRHGQCMVTLDDAGKAYSFTPNENEAVGLSSATRLHRVADKQGFARMIGGALWTSGGPGSTSSGSSSSSKGPTIRYYDIMSPAYTAKLLLVGESVGAVTSGTILPSHPDKIYLGHEGGYVSVWSRGVDGSPPTCVQAIKISSSDVLSLEGVQSRLWAGSRNGTIAAYDVDTKPWTMTNVWSAHQELPVLKLTVDVFAIDKVGRLTVVSVGRDENVRLWDGMLGSDWIEGELLRREAKFSTFRNIKILVCTWNVDAAKPESLVGGENSTFLESVLRSVDAPDIIVFGFQEVINLEDHKLTAKNVLLGSQKRKGDNAISEKVTRQYRLWYDKLGQAVRMSMPHDNQYTVIHTENLVGLFTCIFVRNGEKAALKDVAITTVKRGMGGRYGNKGAIVARFVIDDSSICFINCHLAAGQSHKRERNQDLAAILEEKSVFPEVGGWEPAIAYAGGGDGSMVLDHEICFLNGDLNYRIDQRRESVIANIRAGDLNYLLTHDQLLKEMKLNPSFRLRSFIEAPITFAPTYKYDRKSDEYDTSEKKRVPAWCDRVLYRCRDPSRVQNIHYQRYEANVSDHRPVSAAYRVTVKAVDPEKRKAVKDDIQAEWWERQQQLLIDARNFYVS